jgi:hypothetical protein
VARWFSNQWLPPVFAGGMWHFGKCSAWLLSSLVWCSTTGLLFADTPGNPYLAIAGSNVFRLRPAQHLELAPPPPLLPAVTPVGITTILSKKQALLKVSFPARPSEPAKEVACVLTIGQREGPVEVLAIDETAGSIKINNSGTIMVLTLAKDGPRPQPASLAPGPPPPPGPPARPMERAGDKPQPPPGM